MNTWAPTEHCGGLRRADISLSRRYNWALSGACGRRRRLIIAGALATPQIFRVFSPRYFDDISGMPLTSGFGRCDNYQLRTFLRLVYEQRPEFLNQICYYQL